MGGWGYTKREQEEIERRETRDDETGVSLYREPGVRVRSCICPDSGVEDGEEVLSGREGLRIGIDGQFSTGCHVSCSRL